MGRGGWEEGAAGEGEQVWFWGWRVWRRMWMGMGCAKAGLGGTHAGCRKGRPVRAAHLLAVSWWTVVVIVGAGPMGPHVMWAAGAWPRSVGVHGSITVGGGRASMGCWFDRCTGCCGVQYGGSTAADGVMALLLVEAGWQCVKPHLCTWGIVRAGRGRRVGGGPGAVLCIVLRGFDVAGA